MSKVARKERSWLWLALLLFYNPAIKRLIECDDSGAFCEYLVQYCSWYILKLIMLIIILAPTSIPLLTP